MAMLASVSTWCTTSISLALPAKHKVKCAEMGNTLHPIKDFLLLICIKCLFIEILMNNLLNQNALVCFIFLLAQFGTPDRTASVCVTELLRMCQL